MGTEQRRPAWIGQCNKPITGPLQVGADRNWIAVAAGYNHSLALKSDGTLWAWGLNSDGQLELAVRTSPIINPLQVGTSKTWIAVSAGIGHTIALRSDGTLWAWGLNSNGQLGFEHATSQ